MRDELRTIMEQAEQLSLEEQHMLAEHEAGETEEIQGDTWDS
jgi:hypothetical protein